MNTAKWMSRLDWLEFTLVGRMVVVASIVVLAMAVIVVGWMLGGIG